MVGQNTETAVNLFVSGLIVLARKLLTKLNERRHDIAFIVRTRMLHDGGNTFKAHAGINVAVRELRHGAVFLTIVLRKDEIPKLKVAVSVIAGLLARKLRTLIEVNLRTRATRTRWTGCPEVVLLAQTRNMIFGNT